MPPAQSRRPPPLALPVQLAAVELLPSFLQQHPNVRLVVSVRVAEIASRE